MLAACASALLVGLVAIARPPVPPSADKSWFWRYKAEWREAARVVLAGNSRLYRGLDPQTIEEVSGIAPVLNFGFSGQVWTPEYLDGIEKVLQEEGRGIVVLAVDPPTLRERHARGIDDLARDGYAQALKDLREARVPALWEGRVEELLQPLQPFTPFRTGSLTRREAKRRAETVYVQDWRLNGWVASDYTRRDPGRYLKDYWKGRSEEVQRVDEATLERLGGRISAWRARGIRVFAFRMPASEQTDRFEEKVFGYDEQRVKAALEQAGARWITVADRAALTSYDGSHLTRESAIALSALVARAIAAGSQNP